MFEQKYSWKTIKNLFTFSVFFFFFKLDVSAHLPGLNAFESIPIVCIDFLVSPFLYVVFALFRYSITFWNAVATAPEAAAAAATAGVPPTNRLTDWFDWSSFMTVSLWYMRCVLFNLSARSFLVPSKLFHLWFLHIFHLQNSNKKLNFCINSC